MEDNPWISIPYFDMRIGNCIRQMARRTLDFPSRAKSPPLFRKFVVAESFRSLAASINPAKL